MPLPDSIAKDVQFQLARARTEIAKQKREAACIGLELRQMEERAWEVMAQHPIREELVESASLIDRVAMYILNGRKV